MKKLFLLFTAAAVILFYSCGNSEHAHEDGEPHTHEELSEADHNHSDEGEGDGHNHGSELTGDAVEDIHSESEDGHEEEDGIEDESASELPDGVTLLTLRNQEFRTVTKTGGQILVDKKDATILTAKSSGIVRFSDHFLFAGTEVKQGEEMFTISGEKLTENNIAVRYASEKAAYEKAKADFERATRLIESKSITSAAYLETKKEFEIASARFEALSQTDSSGNTTVIRAPSECYLNEVFVEEGDFVSTGDRLARVTIKHNMVLRADISPTEFDILGRITSAKFTTGYSDDVYNTEQMNGTKISYGRSSDENSWFIPVYFRIDYNESLIPGTFADVWLLGDIQENIIAVPDRAIMEEYGKLYVYVFHDGHFDKRFIETGPGDGEYTMVLNGLSDSETIVDNGAYQVKMSLLTSIPNTHDHNH